MNCIGKGIHIVLSISISMGMLCRVLTAQETAGKSPHTDVAADQDKGLRDVFLGTKANADSSDRTIGRLAILLQDGDSFKQVRPDYSFRSGDRFRFTVAANQDGWLYVLHGDLNGAWKQLWPRNQDDNSIKAHKTYEIPPDPGIFIFDKSVGQEHFYIAIRQSPTPPNLNTPVHPRKEVSPGKTTTPAVTSPKEQDADITNFVVRNPFGESQRGVIFDPGKGDSDPYLYFSSVARDNLKSAMIEFRLNHVE